MAAAAVPALLMPAAIPVSHRLALHCCRLPTGNRTPPAKASGPGSSVLACARRHMPVPTSILAGAVDTCLRPPRSLPVPPPGAIPQEPTPQATQGQGQGRCGSWISIAALRWAARPLWPQGPTSGRGPGRHRPRGGGARAPSKLGWAVKPGSTPCSARRRVSVAGLCWSQAGGSSPTTPRTRFETAPPLPIRKSKKCPGVTDKGGLPRRTGSSYRMAGRGCPSPSRNLPAACPRCRRGAWTCFTSYGCCWRGTASTPGRSTRRGTSTRACGMPAGSTSQAACGDGGRTRLAWPCPAGVSPHAAGSAHVCCLVARCG